MKRTKAQLKILLAEKNYEDAEAELISLYGEKWEDQPEHLIAAIWRKHHFQIIEPLEVEPVPDQNLKDGLRIVPMWKTN